MFLSDHLVLASLGLLILLVLAVLALVLRAATRSQDARAPAGRRAAPRLQAEGLRQSFRQAVELVESSLAPRAQRYQLPWVLVLDEGDDGSEGGQVLPLAEAGVACALGSDAAARVATPGLAWHFFDKGLVVDVQGAALGEPDRPGAAGEAQADRTWDDFLGLCRDYRPERPFDALVVTVPAALLLDPHPEARQALVRMARRAHRRLWLAQNRFAMRFALYVVVSGTERVPGFGAYARALPDMLRRCMLGWSSPYDLATGYRPEWVAEALGHVRRTVADSCAERFAQPGPPLPPEDATPLVLLPSRLAGLQPALQLYLDELMRPSAYHEPFILRGLYLTADAGLAAAAALEAQAWDQTPPAAALADPSVRTGWDRDDAEATEGAAPPPRLAAPPAPPALDADLDDAPLRQPVFLRDLFEQKIFQELGLTRPSGTQQLTRPLMHRGLRWGAWGLTGAWALGLGLGSVVLHQQTGVLQGVLTQLQADLDTQARASRQGQPLPPDWQRQRTLALLQLMEQMDQRRLWSVFMPGSWPVVEGLPARVRQRLESAFADLAVVTLRSALYDQAAQLTGVPQDPATGELIAGAPCEPPRPTDLAATRPTLGLEDLPEFARLMDQIGASGQIDQAAAAMQRLLDPAAAADGQDLRLLVRTTLGVDLPGQPDHAAALFRSQRVRSAGFTLNGLQLALHCGVQRRAAELWQRGLVRNDLLALRTRLGEQLAQRLEPADDEQAADRVDAWRTLLETLRTADLLLQRGGGQWLLQDGLRPGAAWEQLLARTAAQGLLGPAAAQQLREQGDTGLRQLQAQLAALEAQPLAGGVVWDATQARWVLEPSLAGLRDALAQLYALPLMASGAPRELSEGPSGLLAWDTARLDLALAGADLRKRLQTELVPKAPAELREALAGLIDQQVAVQVLDHLALARVPGGRPGGEGPTEAERQRLVRLQALLTELGAAAQADTLQGLMASDASSRLRRLDEALQRAELFTPAGRGFSAWTGDKGPAYAAFGQADAGALAAYLGQQRARLEALDQAAAPLLQALGSRSNSLAERWGALHQDLERYRLKNPNSSLLQLENWLLGLAEVDVDNCTQRTALRPASLSRGHDLAAERQLQLASALAQRCGELRAVAQREALARFGTLFNQQAAGRPPFAAPGWGPEAPAMELDELAALLPAWDQAARAWREAGQDPRQPQALALRRFAEQMDRTRAWLAPLLPADETTPAALDLAVEFRAHVAGELAGSHVIDWALEVGPQRLGWREPPRALRWSPGMPIALVLRLAKDGPLRPQPTAGGAQGPGTPGQPPQSVEGRTVIQRYADPWALLSWIQRHREPEPSGKGDARSLLLKVEIPLALVEGATAAPADGPGRARVFFRLTVSPPGKRQPLVWPGAFPQRAPEGLPLSPT
ncbi:type VI secretion system protein [Ideonella livida]|uniref:Type VI secretion protein IcmF n=1 Tax=Ideonella livida TaxID=2707176 RepID=A0A7C9PHF7_9BURK|nr:type VI secretion system protein [Ideonella livida]NDY91351.1 type VI secretion protein IcmF [Ideonella livida]